MTSSEINPPSLSSRERQAQEALRIKADLMAQLEHYKAQQGWSDADMQRHLGLDNTRMHYWKKGARHFSIDGLMVIFARLGLRPSSTC